MSTGFNMAITGSTAAAAAAAKAAGNARSGAGDESSGAGSSFFSTLENVGQSANQGASQNVNQSASQGAGQKSSQGAGQKVGQGVNKAASNTVSRGSKPAPAVATPATADAPDAAPVAEQAAGAEQADASARNERSADASKDEASDSEGSSPEAAAAVAATVAQLLAAAQAAAPAAAATVATPTTVVTAAVAAAPGGASSSPNAIAAALATPVAGTETSAGTGAATVASTPLLPAGKGSTPAPAGSPGGADAQDALSLARVAPTDAGDPHGASKDPGQDGQGDGDAGFRSLTSLLAASSAAPAPDFNSLVAPGATSGQTLAVPASAASAAMASTPQTPDLLLQPRLQEPVGGSRWADELGARLTLMATRGEQHGALRLSPEHLGPLEVQIHLQDDKASVWFGAQHADTRSALQEALPRLRELFAASGMQLGDAGVSREAPRQARAPDAGERGTAALGTVREDVIDLSVAQAARHVGLLDTYA